MEEWASLEDLGYANYSVSSWGRVRNDRTGRQMQTSINTMGFTKVNFAADGNRHTRSITPLVAMMFLDRENVPDYFDTPIHLDGNKEHNFVDNLMWRPRWYAIKYHKQFKLGIWIAIPIIDINTGEVYPDGKACAIHNGILNVDIVMSIINKTPTPITRQEFAFA